MKRLTILAAFVLCASSAFAQTSLTERSGFKNASSFSGSQGSFTLGFGNGGTANANDLLIGIAGLSTNFTFTGLTIGGDAATCEGPFSNTGGNNVYLCFLVTPGGGLVNPTFSFNVSSTQSGFFGVVTDAFTGERTPSPFDASTGQNHGTSNTTWTTTDTVSMAGLNTGCVNEGVFGALYGTTASSVPTPAGGWTSIEFATGWTTAFQNFTSKQTNLAFTATVSTSVPFTGIIGGFCTATQPAPGKMMPFVAAILNRFFPGFLQLNRWLR
jgi:hypothetical protein